MTAFRKCDACFKTRLIDGGCEITPTRWLCATCWIKRVNSKLVGK